MGEDDVRKLASHRVFAGLSVESSKSRKIDLCRIIFLKKVVIYLLFLLRFHLSFCGILLTVQ